MSKSVFANWDGQRVKLSLQHQLKPSEEKWITSVHAFCFHQDKLLLVKLNHRGWDFPGGHVEENETSEESLRREVMEEAYVEGNVLLLGYIAVDHSENTLWSPDSPYPKVGYQAFYRMDITKLYPFDGAHESSKRRLIEPAAISEYYPNWHEIYALLLEMAFEKSKS